MTISSISRSDRFGLVRPAVDAHTLGIEAVGLLLRDCGYQAVTADAAMSNAFSTPEDVRCVNVIERWLRENRIAVLGFSYRLDPNDGAMLFGRMLSQLRNRRLLADQGGPVKAVYFAGLPKTCELVRRENGEVNGVFCGDETPAETFAILGVETSLLPRTVAQGAAYDEDRLAFGRELVRRGDYLAMRPVDRSDYPGFGTKADTLVARVRHGVRHQLPPVIRAHVGPYLPYRTEAVKLFLQWCRQLAASGFLDVLSIGTSQLTQSNFGEDWGDKPNGGGVPLNSREEFTAVFGAARPMLVRAYAGTRNIPALAKMHEETINIAWHALSLWWFCQVDGRGPYPVLENLRQHVATLRYIAATAKPFEPNVSHHFSFRGADDVTYVVSAVLAARLAKTLGMRHLVLQVMLNTPKYTWGVQDLAKARATLRLVRLLEGRDFGVMLQPRTGLDYLSHDIDKAKAQLAAATALMDDIEPHDLSSPPIIHVVSYSEGSHLADPPTVDESIKITQHALTEYRRLRSKGEVSDMSRNAEVALRTAELLNEARTVLRAIEAAVPGWASAEGLYQVFAMGFLPVPYLWECRDELAKAVQWQTRLVHGAIKLVDDKGMPMSVAERVRRLNLLTEHI